MRPCADSSPFAQDREKPTVQFAALMDCAASAGVQNCACPNTRGLANLLTDDVTVLEPAAVAVARALAPAFALFDASHVPR